MLDKRYVGLPVFLTNSAIEFLIIVIVLLYDPRIIVTRFQIEKHQNAALVSDI